jgi:methyltransferase
MQLSYILLFVYLIKLRLLELILSRRNKILLEEHEYRAVKEKILFPGMVTLHTFFFIALITEFLINKNFVFSEFKLLMLFVFLIAQGIRFWTFFTLQGRWNIKVLTHENKGIIATGLYAYIRHPNYLAVILEFFSIPLLCGAHFTCIVFSILNGIVLFFRIRTEERELFRNPRYAKHFSNKKRFVPFLF